MQEGHKDKPRLKSHQDDAGGAGGFDGGGKAVTEVICALVSSESSFARQLLSAWEQK